MFFSCRLFLKTHQLRGSHLKLLPVVSENIIDIIDIAAAKMDL